VLDAGVDLRGDVGLLVARRLHLVEPVGDLALVLRGGRRGLLRLATSDGEVLRERAEPVEDLLVLAGAEVHELAALYRALDVVGAEHGGGVVEGAGVDVGLDGDVGERRVQAVDLGLGLLLAAPGGGQLGLGGGGGLLGIGQGRLLAGDVGLEVCQCLLDLVVLGAQHVEVGGDIGPLLAHALALLAGVARGAGCGPGDAREHGHGEQPSQDGCRLRAPLHPRPVRHDARVPSCCPVGPS
jgi:hypothetical protein